ncbi:MAG: hypothetical protein ABI442_21460 [Gemmatimonadaceae bacterium]
MVFDGLRQSFDELLQRATKPEERRAVASRMKETLVQARVGLDDLREGLEKAKQRLAAETRELETVQRRKQLAEGISDRATVEVAAKYEQMHQEKVNVLTQKVSVQESELALAERDVESMTSELKAVVSGTVPGSTQHVIDDSDLGIPPADAGLGEEIDSLRRARAHADREADAARRLDELKKKMGK